MEKSFITSGPEQFIYMKEFYELITDKVFLEEIR